MQTFKELYVGGEWVAPDSSEVIEVISPASEEVIGQVPHASTADAPFASPPTVHTPSPLA